jgi:hypothetical protein
MFWKDGRISWAVMFAAVYSTCAILAADYLWRTVHTTCAIIAIVGGLALLAGNGAIAVIAGKRK